MGAIKITVGNHYIANVTEEFLCAKVDITDLDEVEYCAERCCGEFLEMYGDIIRTLDVNWETLVEACYYVIEEVK